MTTPYIYMKRALELANLGKGFVAPNPMVGAVLVCNDKIIGEGYHHRYGQAHAEVMAINSVQDKALLLQSSLYVTLEPCSHYGKTPPCAELIIASKIPHVIVAMKDPFSEVSGRGIDMLLNAGIKVECGLMEAEAQELNKHFISQHRNQQTYIKLKWAESSDHFIDQIRTSAEDQAFVFSSKLRQADVHRQRSEYQAILVGYRTALLDNPSLTNRFCSGNQPLRLVLDPLGELPEDLKLFSDGQAKTVIFYQKDLFDHKPDITAPKHWYDPLRANFLEVHPIDYSKLIEELNNFLRKKQINSLYVEGGASTLQRFIDTEAYHEIEIEQSPIKLGTGISAPQIRSIKS